MAVISAREEPQTGNDDNEGNIGAVRMYLVETNNKNDTWRTVRASPLLPRPGDVFPGSTYLIVLNRSGLQDRARRTRWMVTITYGIPKSTDGSPTGSGSGSDIENEIPEYSVDSETVYEYRNHDLDGRPIKNSANELFVPPLEIPVQITVYTIARNRLTFDNGQAQEFLDTVNSAPYVISATNARFGFASRTALLTKYGGVRRYRADIGFYWRVTWEIKERKDGWRKKFLDHGFMELDESAPGGGGGSTAPNKPIVSKNGLPINGPVLLNGSGKPLAAGGDPVFVPDGLGFKRYHEKDHSALPLSTTTPDPVPIPDFFAP